MQYIDEMYPWTIVDFEKYRTYLELRKERDKFLKSLNEMRNCDWVIEKKLLDAGGLGKTVYIYPTRGGGRNTSIERYLELIESGKDVKIMRASDICKKPNRSYGPYDSDLWDHLDSVVTQKLCDEYIHKDMAEQLRLYVDLFKPKNKIVMDSWNVNPFLTDWYQYGATLDNDAFKIRTRF